jgi:hypothetical protein
MTEMKRPDYWTAEQATAVFEFIDDIREEILIQYRLQIMEYLRDERCVDFNVPDDVSIDEEDLPF